MTRPQRSNDRLSPLRQLLGPAGYLDDDDALTRHARDMSSEAPCRPLAVLRPRDTRELSDAMRLCHGLGLPVVPQGGLTGLSGGAVPSPGSVALSLERMRGIIAVDREDFCLTAWAGTPLQTVQQAALDAGLEYPVDIGARGTATIGGTIATNAGGIRVIRHGMTRQQVLGLEAVLADGAIVSNLRSMIKDNAGFDLKQLFVGSEGCLGIVTRAVLRLSPPQGERRTAIVGLRDYPAALACLASARRHFGGDLTAFEAMWPGYWQAVTAATARRPPLDDRHGLYLLLETTGRDPVLFENWLAQCLEEGLVSDGVVASSLADAGAMWAIRESIGDADGAIGPHLNFDVGLAPSLLGEFADACDAAVAGLLHRPILHFGHVADGNLHMVVPVPNGDEAIAHEVEHRLFALLSQRQGTITAEHGVGTLKRPWLHQTRSAPEIALMRSLKKALDPRNVLNPGKVLPPEAATD